MNVKLILMMTLTILFFSSCEDPEKLKKDIGTLKAKVLLMNAETGSAKIDKEKAEKKVLDLNKTIENKNIEIKSLNNKINDKNKEIENILQNDSEKFWIVKLQPILHQCHKFLRVAPTFMRHFASGAPHYDKVKKNFNYCNRLNTIENLTDRLNFKEARKIAKTKAEYKKIKEAKAEYKKFGIIIKEVHNGIGENLYNFLNEDVIKSFNLEKKYNTPLKIKKYSGSKDFLKKKKHLQSMKSIIFKNKYKLEINNIFDQNYDTSKRAFLKKVGSGYGFGKNKALPPYTYKKFYFPDLEYYQQPSPFGDLRPDVQHLMVKIHEDLAAKIEESPKSFKLFIVYNVTGIKDLKFKFFDNSQNDDGGLHDLKYGVITTSNTEFELVDTRYNKKYYHLDEILEEDGI